MICTICNIELTEFTAFGNPPRKNAQCPNCKSMERHRFAWKYISKQPWLNKDTKILHFAPELSMGKLLKNISGNNYLSADIHKGSAMVVEDITKMSFTSSTFDFVYCSHVMEHITDDRRAFLEIYRVLSDNGYALFMVPIRGEETFEDLSVKTSQDRLRVYGQHDHVRIYGKTDLCDRIKTAGFSVEVVTASSILTAEEMEKFAIIEDFIFLAKK